MATAEPTDDEVEAALRAAPGEAWRELASALAAVEGEARHATWHGGEQVVAIVDGVERAATQLPYPAYTEAVERFRRALTGVRAFVVFDWMHWDGLDRYRRAADLDGAPAADAVRLVTAVVRSERFGDGSIEAALDSGLLTAAARRLLAWHDADAGHG